VAREKRDEAATGHSHEVAVVGDDHLPIADGDLAALIVVIGVGDGGTVAPDDEQLRTMAVRSTATTARARVEVESRSRDASPTIDRRDRRDGVRDVFHEATGCEQ